MEKTAIKNVVFHFDNFSFFYPEQQNSVLSDINFTVKQGEFIVICGPSGCGKSTFLRQFKTVLAPHGHKLGNIYFETTKLDNVSHETQSQKIGFVQQSPDNQIVTDKVWHELAFGLESLGVDTPTIRRRVAEMASFFGIQTWFHKNVNELSGGQKQLLNLASIMVMQPSVLILDEPTSQLDPIAATDFLATVGKINRELGTTIILTEHRLDEAFPLATRVLVMDKGKFIADDIPNNVGKQLKDCKNSMFLAMPTPMRVWSAVKSDKTCPITVSEGRNWILSLNQPFKEIKPQIIPQAGEKIVVQAKEVWFKYEKTSNNIVKGLNLQVKKGEFVALLGGNGTGKTTSLKLLSNIIKPYRGEISIDGKIGFLPQNPQILFVKKTVSEDLYEIFKGTKIPKDEQCKKVENLVKLCRLQELLDRHPYDLSGGEQQRVALCKILLLEPDILLLDEPTKGLDAEFKIEFAKILQNLLAKKVTILMVSHDVEFCAKYTHSCGLFFDGNIVTQETPREFFNGNSFYTTSANRMCRGLDIKAVTDSDLIYACGGEVQNDTKQTFCDIKQPLNNKKSTEIKKLPIWRKSIAFATLILSIILMIKIINITDLSEIITSQGISDFATIKLNIYLILCLIIFTISISRRSKKPIVPIKIEKKLSKRTLVASVIVILLIPITLFIGATYLNGQKYYFIALLVLLECMLPFFLVFEGRKPQARELVVIAVLCAIAISGRAMLFMLPQFKPVMAICIIAGVAFGGETGFLVGAMTMLVSNMLFAQGPWTPFQMFAMGIIGFLAGILFQKGILSRNRLALCTYGLLASIVIYGGIMNPSFALIYSTTINWNIIATYYISGFPMDLIHGIATAIFLWYAAPVMLEKLDRIKIKYGLL